MSWFTRSIVLRGDYVGKRDQWISYRFRFCDDGIYYYAARQADERFTLWCLAHRGRWELGSAANPASGARERLTVIRLEPEFVDLMPEDMTAKPLLTERGLPTDRIEKYAIGLSTTRSRWNRDRDDVVLNFYIPGDLWDFRSTQSWTLRPADGE